MNAYCLWLSWMLSGFCIVLLIIVRIGNYFARTAKPIPEDITLLLRSLDWEAVKTTFNLQDAEEDIGLTPGAISKRTLQFRIDVSREYLQRMDHNASVIRQCARADRQDNLLVSADHEKEKQTILVERRAMLEAAASLEFESKLPEYEDEATDLHAQAVTLRLEAKELESRLQEMAEEDQILPCRIMEVLQAVQRFRAAARIHFFKLNLLSFLLRLDKLHLISTGWALMVWDRGNDNLLCLYEDTRVKATAYLSLYHEDQSLAFM